MTAPGKNQMGPGGGMPMCVRLTKGLARNLAAL
jgi:hypothetical protein